MSDDQEFVPGIAQPEASDGDGHWFVFQKRNLLVGPDDQLEAAKGPDPFGIALLRVQYLGQLNGRDCFSGEVDEDCEVPPGMRFRPIQALYKRLPQELYDVAGRAVQVADWDRNHRYCGACATPTEVSTSDRSRVCPSCGLPHFPRLAPAIITSVERDDEILLARSPHFPPGILSILAGFVEPGESLEQAVVREVQEETGILVENIRYFGSQPWPYPNSLMLGFQADYQSGDVVIDGIEIEEAAWYSAREMPKTFAGDISISQWLIQDFLRRKGSGR